MKKTILVIIMIIILLFTLFGCGDYSDDYIYQESIERAEDFDKENYTAYKYSTLARHPDDCYEKLIKVRGEIFQVIDDDYTTSYLIRIGDFYDGNLLYATIPNENSDIRALEGDDVRFYGISTGIITYETLLETSKSVPSMVIDKIVVLNE